MMNQLGNLLQVQTFKAENNLDFEVSHRKNLTYLAIFDESADKIVFAGNNVCYVSSNQSNDRAVKIVEVKTRNQPDEKMKRKSIKLKKNYDSTVRFRLDAGLPFQ